MIARVHWDGFNWVAEPEAGGVTQARRLDQLPARLSEVVELMTGVAVPTEDWDLDVTFEGPLAQRAAAVRKMRDELDERERSVLDETVGVVRDLRDHGMSFRDIGTLTGISYQRAHQLVSGEAVGV
jgi:hypothetical protein